MAAFNKFDVFTKDVTNGKHDFSSHTFKIMLTNTIPVAANAIKADITEIAAGNGYVAGGVTLGAITNAQTAGVDKVVASADNTITATGPIGPFQWAVMFNDTQTTPAKPLVGWWAYTGPVTMANLETFLLDNDQANGLFTVT